MCDFTGWEGGLHCVRQSIRRFAIDRLEVRACMQENESKKERRTKTEVSRRA